MGRPGSSGFRRPASSYSPRLPGRMTPSGMLRLSFRLPMRGSDGFPPSSPETVLVLPRRAYFARLLRTGVILTAPVAGLRSHATSTP
jgi:hypothetical protein